jgi:hypothetical protein
MQMKGVEKIGISIECQFRVSGDDVLVALLEALFLLSDNLDLKWWNDGCGRRKLDAVRVRVVGS